MINFHITSDAAKKLLDVLISPHPLSKPHFLRISIQGGGCSGFKYSFDIENALEIDDYIFEYEGVTIIIDPVSATYLDGATLNYESELLSSKFVLSNPNIKSTCGCGNSFN